MNVGLPGTGIGGLFYLLSALCMPVVETLRALRAPAPAHAPSGGRWRLVARQTALAAGIGAGLWVTGWLLAIALAGSPAALSALHGAGLGGRLAPNVLQAATLAVSLATLGIVIVTVWVLKIAVHGWRPRKRIAVSVVVRAKGPREQERVVREVDAA